VATPVSLSGEDPSAPLQSYQSPLSDLEFFILVLRRRWKWLITTVAVVTIGGLLAAFLIPPMYQVRVVMAPADWQAASGGGLSAVLGQFGGLAALAGIDLDQDANVKQAIAMLKSQQFTEAFIRDKQLLPVLFADKYDEKTGSWRVPADEMPTLWEGYDYFDREIRRVYEDKRAGTIILQIEWYDRHQAAEWANELAARINAQMRQRDIEEATRTIEHLEKELKKANLLTLQQVISNVLELEVRRRALANARKEYVFRILDPASPPDEDGFVRPKRWLYILLAPFIGLLIGILWVMVSQLIGRVMAATSSSAGPDSQ